VAKCIGHIFDARHGGNDWFCERCGMSYAARLKEMPERRRSRNAQTQSSIGGSMNKPTELLLETHIQRCRDAIAECPNWSPAQAEWSRARDALLNFRDEARALTTDTTGDKPGLRENDGSAI
jgi:hypothetical protein